MGKLFVDTIFITTIEKYKLIEKNNHVLVGLSGGADSVTLLHLLCFIRDSYNLRITAVHINHGLRAQAADDDEAYCKLLCAKLSVEIITRKVSVTAEANEHGLTEEEAGRKLRYDAFKDIADTIGADKIAVAHNKNDLAETVLMNFIRGAGPKGLASIPIKRGEIVRPLLFISREDIEDYCKRNDLDFRTDESNTDLRYKRNRIRHKLMPLLETYNPNLTETLAKTAQIATEENDYLEELTQDIFDKIAVKDNGKLSFSINELHKQPIVLRKRILRKAALLFSKDFHDIYYKHINILLELLVKNSGKKVNLPNGLTVYSEFDRLCFSNTESSAPYAYELELNKPVFVSEVGFYCLLSREHIQKKCGLLYSEVFCADDLPDALVLRTRRKGDRIYLSSEKKLKDYMIDKKMPREDRDACPLIASGHTVLWLVGHIVSKKYTAKETDKHIFYISIYKEENENERYESTDLGRRD